MSKFVIRWATHPTVVVMTRHRFVISEEHLVYSIRYFDLIYSIVQSREGVSSTCEVEQGGCVCYLFYG